MESTPIIVEQIFDKPVDRVWKAITDPGQMRQWFFEPIPDFKPEAGFETSFNVNVEGRDYPHIWKLIEVIPGRKLVYDWRYGGYSGKSVVYWELKQSGQATVLTIAHHGWETFPQDEVAFNRPSGEAGWRYFICERLKAFLDG